LGGKNVRPAQVSKFFESKNKLDKNQQKDRQAYILRVPHSGWQRRKSPSGFGVIARCAGALVRADGGNSHRLQLSHVHQSSVDPVHSRGTSWKASTNSWKGPTSTNSW